MKSNWLNCICFLIMTTALLSCRNDSSSADGENSIYYWRTTFSLSDDEREFLKDHDISKIYVRFFDVDFTYDADGSDDIVPQATIVFNDSVPCGINIVPTVYITNQAIEQMQLKESEYADKIIKRVNAICRKNNLEFDELQLDCDWTRNTQKHFFKLCSEIKSRIDSAQCLSSTIRLHQLTQTPPPVDKGVLMVYNTGNLMELTSENSIFSYKDIEAYLRDDRLSRFDLPLDVAYPAYGWSIVFYPAEDKYCFERLMRRTDFSSYPGLKQIDDNLYEATSLVKFSTTDELDCVYPESRVKVERPDADEILKVKKLIDRRLKGKSHNNILYHLDESQLSHYSDNEINKIYHRD